MTGEPNQNSRRWTLTNCAVTANALLHLKGNKSLVDLELGRTSIDDSELLKLKEMTSIRSLRISNQRVTEPGVDKLRQIAPTLVVVSIPVSFHQ
jgi:hypothetical protein